MVFGIVPRSTLLCKPERHEEKSWQGSTNSQIDFLPTVSVVVISQFYDMSF